MFGSLNLGSMSEISASTELDTNRRWPVGGLASGIWQPPTRRPALSSAAVEANCTGRRVAAIAVGGCASTTIAHANVITTAATAHLAADPPHGAMCTAWGAPTKLQTRARPRPLHPGRGGLPGSVGK